MYERMYVCMYVHTCVCSFGEFEKEDCVSCGIGMHFTSYGMYICMHICMYVCMYVQVSIRLEQRYPWCLHV